MTAVAETSTDQKRIVVADELGYCWGVRRALDIIEDSAQQAGPISPVGDIIHNPQVVERLKEKGILGTDSVDTATREGFKRVAITAHGMGPHLAEEASRAGLELVDTTCPLVTKVQRLAQKLVRQGYFLVVYGDSYHPEVKGVLGWAKDKGLATVDEKTIVELDQLPRHVGVLTQTTQIPAHFTEFVKRLIDSTLIKGSELRIIDTICHDIRRRQAAALKLANRVDLMLVIGGHTSANTNHLVQLCSTATKTYLVESAEEIQPSWLQARCHVGITAGASTDEQTINEVLTRLENIA